MEGGESAATFAPVNEVKAVVKTPVNSPPLSPSSLQLPVSYLKLCHRENTGGHISRKLHCPLLHSGPQRDLMSGNGGLLVMSY